MNVIRYLMDRSRPLVRLRRRLFGPARPTWTEDFEVVATVLKNGTNLSTLLPLAIQRKIIEPQRPPTPVVRETTLEHARLGGVPVVWFARADSDRDRVIVYLHGGGYSIGSIHSHTDLIARIAKATGARVVAPEYRLAPEYPFPTQLEDSIAVFRALLAGGVSPARIVLAGESAGGGLSLSTMVALRDRGMPLPAAAVLISPWVDLEAASASVLENAAWDFVTRRGLDVYARRFVRAGDLRNPLAAPIYADLRGLPPLLVQVGEAEALRDDGVRLAERAREAGVPVELEVWPDMIHAFHVFAPLLEPAREAIERIGDFARARANGAAAAAGAAS